MVQAIARSKARLTERQQSWLDHLRVCREQGHTLRGYAKAHGLSVSGLYTAHSTLKSRGALSEPAPSAPCVHRAAQGAITRRGRSPAADPSRPRRLGARLPPRVLPRRTSTAPFPGRLRSASSLAFVKLFALASAPRLSIDSVRRVHPGHHGALHISALIRHTTSGGPNVP